MTWIDSKTEAIYSSTSILDELYLQLPVEVPSRFRWKTVPNHFNRRQYSVCTKPARQRESWDVAGLSPLAGKA